MDGTLTKASFIQERSVIRYMRGVTKARLVAVAGKTAYVVKSIDNPYGVKVLIAEWIAGSLMTHLGLPVPPMAAICSARPDIRSADPPNETDDQGVVYDQFGSLYPGDPYAMAVYDFVPESFLAKIHLKDAIAGCMVFDVWVNNTDYRQAIFFRNELVPGTLTFQLIDNSHVFGGPEWPLHSHVIVRRKTSLGIDQHAYSRKALMPWVTRIEHLLESGGLSRIGLTVPASWLELLPCGELQRLNDTLTARGERLGEHVDAQFSGLK